MSSRNIISDDFLSISQLVDDLFNKAKDERPKLLLYFSFLTQIFL